ncbi:PadR family transcriptional regulator [Planctomicrobium sp.]|jgi:PadR family transcriptional regulator, regulatory protein PadR|nr:PadR family transcriptional regulator [Planctomicrobium sp.]MDB4731248.1 PadR family transcriptional regulator [bacterium]
MDAKLISGMLDLLILETLSPGPSYGYEITQSVLSRSDGKFELKEGSLYPALHRLERNKSLKSFWQEYEGRRRKYYQITAVGKKLLAAKRTEWKQFTVAVNGVLGIQQQVIPHST